jgi:predicted permease
MIAQLFAIIAPILVCSAVGYGWARIKAPFHSQTLGSLVFLVGTPCLVFSTLTAIRLEPAVSAPWRSPRPRSWPWPPLAGR